MCISKSFVSTPNMNYKAGSFIAAAALLCAAPLPTIIVGMGFEAWQYKKQAGKGTYGAAARRLIVFGAFLSIAMSYILPEWLTFQLQSAATTAFFVGLTFLFVAAQSAPDSFRPATELHAVFKWKPTEPGSIVKETAGSLKGALHAVGSMFTSAANAALKAEPTGVIVTVGFFTCVVCSGHIWVGMYGRWRYVGPYADDISQLRPIDVLFAWCARPL